MAAIPEPQNKQTNDNKWNKQTPESNSEEEILTYQCVTNHQGRRSSQPSPPTPPLYSLPPLPHPTLLSPAPPLYPQPHPLTNPLPTLYPFPPTGDKQQIVHTA